MKIVIAGDFCPRYRIEDVIDKTNNADCLVDDEISSIIQESDYSVVNLECPIIPGPKVYKPIKKCGPNLKGSYKSLSFLKTIGFKCVSLANNHILDYGEGGVIDTIDSCKRIGFDYVGAGSNLSESQSVLYKNVNNKLVAFINCCEHEFSIAGSDSAGANPLNSINQYYSITQAKSKSDYVIVIVHGGHEHFQYPSPRMQDLYRFFIDCGADVVVNHHQHCYSGYEQYNGKMIFYGLGNFCFDDLKKRSGIWTEGCLLELSIESQISFKLIPYIQCAEKANVRLMDKCETVQFEDKLQALNNIIEDRKLLFYKHQEWMKSTEIDYLLALSPYSNRYLKAAAHRSLLPMGLTEKKILLMTNYILCESHRDRLVATLLDYFKTKHK